MTSDELSQPEPRDALVPSSRRPPTADVEHIWHMAPEFKQFVNSVLDAIDRVAERIAVELGVRERGSGSSSSGPPAA
jgi:hypothetical protein